MIFMIQGLPANVNQNNIAMLARDIKNNMNQVKNQALVCKMAEAVSNSAANYNELYTINNRILQILNQQ